MDTQCHKFYLEARGYNEVRRANAAMDGGMFGLYARITNKMSAWAHIGRGRPEAFSGRVAVFDIVHNRTYIAKKARGDQQAKEKVSGCLTMQ